MSPENRIDRNQRGFTLLEILVAMAVFAVISVIAYRGLNSVIDTKTRLDQEMHFWRDLGQIFDRMEADFVQLTPLTSNQSSAQLLQPLRSHLDADGAITVEFLRLDNSRLPVHAAYRCHNHQLMFMLWPQTDTAPAAGASREPKAQSHLLQEHVEQCAFSYLDRDNKWLPAWPDNASSPRPRAIRIQMTLTDRGDFERIFFLP